MLSGDELLLLSCSDYTARVWHSGRVAERTRILWDVLPGEKGI